MTITGPESRRSPVEAAEEARSSNSPDSTPEAATDATVASREASEADANPATPADELRSAAERLRTLAKGAPSNGARYWRHAKGSPSDSVRTENGWEVCYGDTPGDLRYIAAMHPEVGLALADWLTDEARRISCASSVAGQEVVGRRALAVARAINAAAVTA